MTVGVHYGRVRRLAKRGEDGPFRLGEDVFRGGGTGDIAVSKEWDFAFYFGVQLSPRIITSLVSR